ncbi:MAG: hypothetical protein JRE73_10320 [Deltaproteobacteria bacterium]|nr:hypothetical protein [Deltaproteobacteria bacterium]
MFAANRRPDSSTWLVALVDAHEHGSRAPAVNRKFELSVLFAIKRGWRASVLRSLYRAGALGVLARSRRRSTWRTHGANIDLMVVRSG